MEAPGWIEVPHVLAVQVRYSYPLSVCFLEGQDTNEPLRRVREDANPWSVGFLRDCHEIFHTCFMSQESWPWLSLLTLSAVPFPANVFVVPRRQVTLTPASLLQLSREAGAHARDPGL